LLYGRARKVVLNRRCKLVHKKGMEMSMNVIIVAVIAILILVILVYLLGSRFEWFGNKTKCFEAGGRCQSEKCDPGSEVPGLEGNVCGKQFCCSIVPDSFGSS
jgi:hypothetical protein